MLALMVSITLTKTQTAVMVEQDRTAMQTLWCLKAETLAQLMLSCPNPNPKVSANSYPKSNPNLNPKLFKDYAVF